MKSKLFGFLSVFMLAASLCVVSAYASISDGDAFYGCVTSTSSAYSSSSVLTYAAYDNFVSTLPVGVYPKHAVLGTVGVTGYSFDYYSFDYNVGMTNVGGFRLVAYDDNYYVIAFSATPASSGAVGQTFYLCNVNRGLYLVERESFASWLQIISGRLQNIGLQLDLVNSTLSKISDNLVFFMNDRMHTLIPMR